MHGGILMLARQHLTYARPWPRGLVSAALVVGGVVLMTLGLTVGFVATALGLVSSWPIWHAWRR
ncbi:MAG TPA: hypothetical protein VGL48_10145, partial [Acidimicrobiales bacterium]